MFVGSFDELRFICFYLINSVFDSVFFIMVEEFRFVVNFGDGFVDGVS